MASVQSYGTNAAAVNNAPTYGVLMNVFNSNGTVNNTTLFANSSPSAFQQGAVYGMYGFSTTKVANAQAHGVKNMIPGWYLIKNGMGGIRTFTGLPVGSGYSNLDIVHVTATGATNATANVSTNSTGGVVGLSLNGVGQFSNVSSLTVAIANTTGGAANGTGFLGVSVTLGGRAGRRSVECLTVSPSMTGNSSYVTPIA
jgi:hypothetical protein